MSSIAFAPLREIVAHSAHVRDHRSFLAFDFLAKLSRAQAPRCRSYQLAPKPLASSDCRAISHSMPNRIPEAVGREAVLTATAPSRLRKPMQSVSGTSTARAGETPARP